MGIRIGYIRSRGSCNNKTFYLCTILYIRGDIKGIGIIFEVQRSTWFGIIYYVQTNDGVWRFSDYELELLDESR